MSNTVASQSAGLPNPTSTSLTSGKGNALSSRITNVLSASYSDLEIREALQTLDDRKFVNTAESRRNLHLDLQQELIQCNGLIVKDFGQVAEQLRRVGSALDALKKSCADIRSQVDLVNNDTAPVLKEASSLLAQRTEVGDQQKLLNAFKAHFLISEEDVVVLTSNSQPVDDVFFRTVTKIKVINSDSRHLLGTENENLGLDILEQSSKQLNVAYQKLYRWIQKEFKTLDLENPQIGKNMRRGIRVLAERPQLFQSWMDSFADNREQILLEAFQAALTGTLTGSDSRPIDFQAHDPLRYVGDMLAWVHSAAVSEREALEMLFISEGHELAKGVKEGMESDPFSQREEGDAPFDGKKALSDLVSRDIAGVGRLLRQKTEQVATSHDDATLVYRIANLIGFYKTTLVKVLASDAAFLDVLSNLEAFAMRQFRVNMQDHLATIQPELTQLPTEPSPPEFLEEALTTLRALLKAYESSSATSNGDDIVEAILKEALDPFLSACQALSKRLSSPQDYLFTINCLQATKTTLTPFEATRDRSITIDEVIAKHITLLKDYQYQYLLESSGLEALIDAISELDDTDEAIATLPQLPPFAKDQLVQSSQVLDDFLPSAIMDANDNIKPLRNTRLVAEITEAAAERFCEAFEALEAKLVAADQLRLEQEGDEDAEDDENKKPLLREPFPRTSGEIRVLLS